ncbi:hypothetical protein [Streptomyces sp. NPDC001415]
MSESTPHFGLFDITYAASWSLGREAFATEAKPEDIGTLSLRYRKRRPEIVVSGGRYIPAKLEDPTLTLEVVDWRDPGFSREEQYWRLETAKGNPGQTADPEPLTADQIDPAEVAQLELSYRDSVPAITASGESTF